MSRRRDERRYFTKKYVEKQKRNYLTSGWGSFDSEITLQMLGYWKKHAFADCGRSNCQMCRNPRRVKWNPEKQRLPIQERKFLPVLKEQLEEYYASTDA